MKCDGCDKIITKDMNLEYSKTLSKLFCSYDCAIDYIANYCRLIPITYGDALKEERYYK